MDLKRAKTIASIFMLVGGLCMLFAHEWVVACAMLVIALSVFMDARSRNR